MSNDCAPTFSLSRVAKLFEAEMAIAQSFQGSEPIIIAELADRRAARSPSIFARRYTERAVEILLLGTYELGRQPFGLASPAAWLRKRGHAVECLDLSRQSLQEATVDA